MLWGITEIIIQASTIAFTLLFLYELTWDEGKPREREKKKMTRKLNFLHVLSSFLYSELVSLFTSFLPPPHRFIHFKFIGFSLHTFDHVFPFSNFSDEIWILPFEHLDEFTAWNNFEFSLLFSASLRTIPPTISNFDLAKKKEKLRVVFLPVTSPTMLWY